MRLVRDIRARLIRPYGKDVSIKEILALLQFNVLWDWLICRGLWIAKDYTRTGSHQTEHGARRFLQKQKFLQKTFADFLILHVVVMKAKDSSSLRN